MTISLPTHRVLFIDIPDVPEFNSEFVYNFFTVDESTNETGTVPASLLTKPSESFDSKFINSTARLIPRFINLSWHPVPFVFNSNQRLDNIDIKTNLNKIVDENLFASDDYFSINFQDNQLDGRLSFLTQNVLKKKISIANEAIKAQINSIASSINNNLASLSLIEKARMLNATTPNQVTSQFLVNSLTQIQALGAFFVDERTKKEITDRTFDKLKKIKTITKINKKVLDHLIESSIEDVIALYADELAPIYEQSKSISQEAIRSYNSALLNGDEYKVTIPNIEERIVDNVDNFPISVSIIGYIIDKYEIVSTVGGFDQKIKKESIVIQGKNVSNTIDFKIKYGTTYEYTIKSVAAVETLAYSEATRRLVAATFLVSSTPTSISTVSTFEYVPPEPPADFDIYWNYEKRKPVLTWCFPVTPQRDVKIFQVFRRKTINDSFELIKEYDFDDSEIKYNNNERPSANIVETVESPILHFVDLEFTSTDKYIYTVCCLDAHGMSSTYAEQFEISFDKFHNKLIKNYISTSGAPKPYPNMYLTTDTFVDSIRDTGSEKISIYFMPEFYNVYDPNSNTNITEISTTNKSDGKYILSVVNLDLQKQEDITINIEDLRTRTL